LYGLKQFLVVVSDDFRDNLVSIYQFIDASPPALVQYLSFFSTTVASGVAPGKGLSGFGVFEILLKKECVGSLRVRTDNVSTNVISLAFLAGSLTLQHSLLKKQRA
jgi:hypothetical protein